MTIYVLTNRVNGRSYVGQAGNVMKRLYEHVRVAKKNAEMLISRAIHKHGQDAFSVRLIALGEGATRDDANTAERWWIARLGTLYPRGYNLTAGGYVQDVLPVTRERMSRARLGWSPSESTREKLRAALKGRALSDETRAKMSAARKGKKQTPRHVAARNAWKRSEETKRKISAKKRARDAAMTPEQRLAQADHCRGKSHSEEMRAKLRAGSKRRWDRYRAELSASDGVKVA